MIRRGTGLRHYWRAHLTVAAGVAVATAVLTGALLVGDSVRSSLRQLAAERLGRIEHALTTPGYFRTHLADTLATSLGRPVVPAILGRANAEHAATGLRASAVSLVGVDPKFGRDLYGVDDPPWTDLGNGDDRVVLNRALADELGAEVGDRVFLRVARWSAIPRASLLGRKETAEVLKTLRLEVTGIVSDRGIGRFSLVSSQRLALNAFVPIATLAKALAEPGLANTLLVGSRSASDAAEENDRATADVARLPATLRAALTLEDFGFAVKRDDRHLSVTSRELVLPAALAAAVDAATASLGLTSQPILTYLANTMAVGDAEVPYATIAAVDPAPELPGLTLVDGSPAPRLGPDEIYLNEWAAAELAAGPGDNLTIAYFVVGDGETLTTAGATLHVAGVVAMRELGADPTLTPDFPGIHDARNMADWDPPFPVDFGRIRRHDEDYWDDWRAAPKGFVALATGRRLWSSRWGNTTAIRIAVAADRSATAIESALRASIAASLDPSARGFAFAAVKARALDAATGATDFSVLFIAFSFFLIAAAVLLVGLLFSLGVEQRAGELGLLLALGFSVARVRRRFIGEGLLVAAIGGIVGTVGALAYSGLMMAGLRSRWRPAVGTNELFLHVDPATLVIGYLAAVAISAWAIRAAVGRLARASVVSLVAGRPRIEATGGRRARARVVMGSALLVAVGCLIASLGADASAAVPLFFGIGGALLIAGLAGFAVWSHRRATTGLGIGTTASASLTRIAMGAASAARNPGRSLLSVSLVGCAAFVLVTAAASRRETVTATDRQAPAGGFTLVGETDTPVYHRVETADGRFELGFADADEAALAGTALMPFRLLPGDDTSCLNLYRPERPRVLGVPRALIERGGFQFAKAGQATENPWTLLDLELEPGVVPAIGDSETLQWILRLGLGDELTVAGGNGPVRLRIVAILKASMFQSELLIGPDAFAKHFPEHDGRSFFLVDAPIDAMPEVTAALERGLADYGLDVSTTASRLAGFHAIANTYIGTFQTLGGLGLLLGTLGLAVVLHRNVLERRGELATMRAFGFTRASLTFMVSVENAFLLVVGLGLGTVAALVAVWPSLRGAAASMPWAGLAQTLGSIAVVGVIAGAVAAAAALRAPLLPALKGD